MLEYGLKLFILSMALWSAHVAGYCYARASMDPSYKRTGIIRTVFSVVMAGALLMIH